MVAVVIGEACIRRKLDKVAIDHARFVEKSPSAILDPWYAAGS